MNSRDLIRPALPALAEETRSPEKSGPSDTDVLRGIIADNQLVIIICISHISDSIIA